MTGADLLYRFSVLFLPGAIAVLLIRHLTIHKPFALLYFIVYSVLVGLFCYISLQFLNIVYYCIISLIDSVSMKKLSYELKIWNSLLENSKKIPGKEVILATILSPIIGYVISAIFHNKLLLRIARKLQVSNRIGDEDIWSYFLASDTVGWVFVRDKESNLTYYGNVVAFSEPGDGVRELVLDDVSVYSSDTSTYLYDSPAVYLSGDKGKFSIELPTVEGDFDGKEQKRHSSRKSTKSKRKTGKQDSETKR